TKRPPVSSRRTLIAMTRKHETHSPGKTMFLVIWWMSKNPYAAVFENRIAAEAAANVRNAILVTFAGKGTEVEAVVDWFRRDDEPRHRDVLGDEWVRTDPFDLRADIFLEIPECMEIDLRGIRVVLLGQGVLEVLVLERQHSAVGVIDHEELLRPEELVRDDKR